MTRVERRDEPRLDLVDLAHRVVDSALDGGDVPRLSQVTRAEMIAAIRAQGYAVPGAEGHSDAWVASYFARSEHRRAERIAKQTGK